MYPTADLTRVRTSGGHKKTHLPPFDVGHTVPAAEFAIHHHGCPGNPNPTRHLVRTVFIRRWLLVRSHHLCSPSGTDTPGQFLFHRSICGTCSACGHARTARCHTTPVEVRNGKSTCTCCHRNLSFDTRCLDAQSKLGLGGGALPPPQCTIHSG